MFCMRRCLKSVQSKRKRRKNIETKSKRQRGQTKDGKPGARSKNREKRGKGRQQQAKRKPERPEEDSQKIEVENWSRTTQNLSITLCHNSTPPSFFSLTSPRHSSRHRFISARSFLSSIARSIQRNNASSSSGTKKDDRRERTVSKFAWAEVRWSVFVREDHNHQKMERR